MIRFFRFSGPLQFGALFLLIWIFKLPLFFTNAPLLWEDIDNLSLGEKLSDGFLIYRDIINTTGPIAAFIYWMLSLIITKSVGFFYIVAAILLFIQSQIFKWVCNNNEILSERGDLQALIYVIVATTCFDFFSLSPAFISVTFVLVALNSIFKHIKSENNEGEIFTTGIFLGLAYLTFAPAIVLFLLSMFTFLVFTRTSFRYYLLYATGFLFPVLSCYIVFYLLDGGSEFANFYLFQFPAAIGFDESINWRTISFLVLPSFLFTFFGIIRAASYRRFIIYQVISQRIMFIWLLVIWLVVFFFFKNVTSSFFLLVPFLAFFITHFFQLMSKKRLGGFLLFIFLIYNLRMVYSYIEIPYLNRPLINFNNQVANPNKWSKIFQEKKILVIGKENEIYFNNKLATCYFDFELSKSILKHPEYYENVAHIYKSFLQDMPEVIIDNEALMPAILEKIPYLKRRFYESQKGVYIRK